MSDQTTVKNRYGSQGVLGSEAKGKWVEILSALAPELDDAIDGHKDKKHVPCPNHGGSDGFRLFYSSNGNATFNETGGGICNTCGPMNNGFKLLAWILAIRDKGNGTLPARWGSDDPDYREYLGNAYREVAFYLEHGYAKNPALRDRPKRVMRALTDEEKKRQEEELRIRNERILEIGRTTWQDAVPFHPMIAAYFENRGLKNPVVSPMMRVNPLTVYVAKNAPITYHPAIVMPVSRIDEKGELKIIALHRIYLHQHEDGRVTKLAGNESKKILPWGNLEGAVIRLYKENANSKILVLGEGPETVSTIHSYTGLPGYSTVTAWGMENAQIPEWADIVVIAMDYDVSGKGQSSAEKLAERVRELGKTPVILSPQDFYDPAKHEKGVDWDDAFKIDPERAMIFWNPYMEMEGPAITQKEGN